MPMELAIALLHSLCQADQNEVLHEFLGHVTPLAPAMASHDVDSIVNGTITFLMSQQNKMQHDFLVM